MSPYITFREKDRNGDLQYYVLQRAHPHYVGRVSPLPIAENWCAPIAGYRLWMIFDSTLIGRFIPSHKEVSHEIQTVLEAMAAWYWSDRIVVDEKRYKKFKIHDKNV